MRPVFTPGDAFRGKPLEATPAGKYTMKLYDDQQFTVVKASTGNAQLKLFFVHADDKNKSLKGVNGMYVITGVGSDGKSNLARTGANILSALGFSADDIEENRVTIDIDYDEKALEAADWKGVPATIRINDELKTAMELSKTPMTVVVKATESGGVRAGNFYRAN